MNNWRKEGRKEWKEWNEWKREWINKWMNEGRKEWMDEWRCEWMQEWMNDWKIEWNNEGRSAWMNVWMNEWSPHGSQGPVLLLYNPLCCLLLLGALSFAAPQEAEAVQMMGRCLLGEKQKGTSLSLKSILHAKVWSIWVIYSLMCNELVKVEDSTK